MADMQTLSVIEEARRRGLNVPSDISVVGFNNIPEAATGNLTTIDSNGAEKGRVAARLVFSAGQVRHEILPTLLVVRGTTAAASPHEHFT
jgi:LacI family transcriptional regulator